MNFLKYYGDVEVAKKIVPDIKMSVVILVISIILILIILFVYKKKKIKL